MTFWPPECVTTWGFIGFLKIDILKITFHPSCSFPQKVKKLFGDPTIPFKSYSEKQKSKTFVLDFVWLPEWGDALRKQSRRLFLASELRERQAGSNLLRSGSDKTLNRGFKSYNDNKKCHTFVWHFGSPSRIWTYDLVINSHLLHRWAIGEYI